MRINLFAGPGAGKSTTSAWIFAELKKKGYSVELVSEYVKGWAISNRPVVGFDQVYLLGKQMQYEWRLIANGIKTIVTDSPILLSACYAKLYCEELNIHSHMEAIVAEYEKRNPSINIFLNRDNKPYKTEGRYQSENQAKELDLIVRDTLNRLTIPYTEFSFYNEQGILKHVIDNLYEY